MYCQEVHEKLNQFVDGELSAFEARVVQRHVGDCPQCGHHLNELELVRRALSSPVYLPDGSRKRMRQALLTWTRRRWSDYPSDFLRNLLTALRDLDRRSALCRLSALPVSFVFLCALASQLPRLPVQQWTFPVHASELDSPATSGRPPVLVQVLQSNASVNELVDTAWKIPYEDSFSLIAKISPEGNARIESILVYPKTMELLHAVDLTLRESHFDGTSEMSNAFLIYSFQKVDVYEGL